LVLVDVNVLVGAMRSDALRVLTHPRVFSPPTPTAAVLQFVQVLRATPNALVLPPGPRHWGSSSTCSSVLPLQAIS
jgi:hypothetical protein